MQASGSGGRQCASSNPSSQSGISSHHTAQCTIIPSHSNLSWYVSRQTSAKKKKLLVMQKFKYTYSLQYNCCKLVSASSLWWLISQKWTKRIFVLNSKVGTCGPRLVVEQELHQNYKIWISFGVEMPDRTLNVKGFTGWGWGQPNPMPFVNNMMVAIQSKQMLFGKLYGLFHTWYWIWWVRMGTNTL